MTASAEPAIVLRSTIPRWREDAMQLSKVSGEFTRYLVERRGCSPRTRDKYDDDYGQFIAFVLDRGGNDIRSFTADNVEAFAAMLVARGIAASTVGAKLSALASLAKYAMRQKGDRGKYLLTDNPVTRIERPKRQEPAIKHLSVTELRALLAAPADAGERLALALLADQPLRVTEWTDANVGQLTVSGDRTALTVVVKGGRTRSKVLGDDVAAQLAAVLRQREAQPDEPLLLNTQGNRYSRQTFSEMVSRNARRAGITRIAVRAHVIRHSIASIAAENGATVYEIAEMLNHRNLQTAQKYIHGITPDAALQGVREALKGGC